MSKRGWNLLEWTVKALVVSAVAIGFGLMTAQSPSADDVWRPLIPAVVGFLINRPAGGDAK